MRKNSFFGISFLVAVAAVFAGVRLLPHARVWLKAHAVVVPFHVMRTYAGAQSGTQITYYGGPVMGGSTNAYVVYYGNWASSSQNIVNTWLQHLGGSELYNINTTYFDTTGAEVRNIVNYNPATNSYLDNYSLGTNLTDANIQTVISKSLAINGGTLPTDDNGAYFVLTSPDVSETAFGATFCGSFCGYHNPSTTIISGHTIKYSFVGSPAACPSACDGNIINGDSTTPNGDVGADGAINVMFHELSETVSDPVITAWGEDESENGDQCNFNFGTFSSLPQAGNGAHYNVTFCSRTSRNVFPVVMLTAISIVRLLTHNSRERSQAGMRGPDSADGKRRLGAVGVSVTWRCSIRRGRYRKLISAPHYLYLAWNSNQVSFQRS